MSNTVNLRARISDELNRAPTDIIGPASLSVGLVINREINAAIKHYESTRFRWNEVREATLATTVAGTRNYSLPAVFLKMDTLKLVYSGSYILIRPKSWQDIEEIDLSVTGNNGLPDRFALYGNILRLYPPPNGAYTLIGSYIRRFGPTSISPSLCLLIPMAGSSTFTPTTTASHWNRLDGWTTDGEELNRERAKAGVRINYLYDPAAIAERDSQVAAGQLYLSVAERIAFERLADETQDALASGFVKPYPV